MDLLGKIQIDYLLMEICMNPWVFVFFISIIVFISLIDWRSISVNIWGGIIAAVLQLIQNIIAYSLNLWKHYRVAEGLPQSIIFSDYINIFIIGIAFTMGVIFFQFLPQNLILQFIHAIGWIFFFRLLHQITADFELINHVNWSIWATANLIPVHMLSLAWVKNSFFNRKFKVRNS